MFTKYLYHYFIFHINIWKYFWKFNYDFISLVFPGEMQRCKFPRCGPARNGWTIEPRNKRKLFCRCELARGKGLAISGYRSVIQLLDLHSAPSTIVPFFPSPSPIPPPSNPAPTLPPSHPRHRCWFVITLCPRHNGVKQEITKLILWVYPRVHRDDDNFVNVK